MFAKYIVVLSLFIYIADCAIEDYRFESEINGYLKLHHVPAKWQDARLRCHLEALAIKWESHFLLLAKARCKTLDKPRAVILKSPDRTPAIWDIYVFTAGGVLASPTNPNELTAMTNIMAKSTLNPNRVYTGIHSTYSSGDYTTLAGVPLSQIDVKWQRGEPNNFENKQDCLILLESGELSDVDCESDHPYICYKSIEKIDIHKCGPQYVKSDYRFENRTGSCYKFHKEGKSWSQAFKTCIAEVAYLAIINSKLESEVLSEIFNEYPHHAIPGDFQKDASSIGFSMWREYGEWFTIHGTSIAEAGFSMFNQGEPNNVGGTEWCGSISRNGYLNDHHCPTFMTFICEKSPSDEDVHLLDYN